MTAPAYKDNGLITLVFIFFNLQLYFSKKLLSALDQTVLAVHVMAEVFSENVGNFSGKTIGSE